MSIRDWAGCRAPKCPYGKEYGNCEMCRYLIRKEDLEYHKNHTPKVGEVKNAKTDNGE